MEYAKMLNSANSQFKKLSDLDIDKHYKVDFYEVIVSNYGEQLVANIDNFKLSLPPRFNKFIPEIKNINKNPPGLIYKGKIKNNNNNKEKHNIIFKNY